MDSLFAWVQGFGGSQELVVHEVEHERGVQPFEDSFISCFWLQSFSERQLKEMPSESRLAKENEK